MEKGIVSANEAEMVMCGLRNEEGESCRLFRITKSYVFVLMPPFGGLLPGYWLVRELKEVLGTCATIPLLCHALDTCLSRQVDSVLPMLKSIFGAVEKWPTKPDVTGRMGYQISSLVRGVLDMHQLKL
jgi:hypothetical protein